MSESPPPAAPGDARPQRRAPEIREQRVKDPVTGNVQTIRVKILRGGRNAERPRAD